MLERLFRRELRASPENPKTSLSNPAQWLVDWAGGTPTHAGEKVSEHSSSTNFQAGVRVISETFGMLPLKIFRLRKSGGRDLATDHDLYSILKNEWNPRQTSFTAREQGQAHVDTWGNGFFHLPRRGSRIEALEPLLPDRMTVYRRGDRLWYAYAQDPRVQIAEDTVFSDEEILHVPGPGFDGIAGKSVVQVYREAIGLGKAMETFGASWFGNGSRVSGLLKHPGQLKGDAALRVAAGWDALHRGPANAGKTAVLEEGMDWVQIGIPPEDAQFLQSREFQLLEICRILRLQPTKLAHLANASFQNTEQLNLDFKTDTMLPRCVRWEQELNRKLFSRIERETFYVKFDLDGLVRGDLKTRYESYALGRQYGFLNGDEIRELEELNPTEGGDVYLVPVNLRDISEPPPPPTAENPPQGAGGFQPKGDGGRDPGDATRAMLEPIAAEAVRRVLRREAEQVQKLFRTSTGLAAWNSGLNEIYAGLDGLLQRNFEPIRKAAAVALELEAPARISDLCWELISKRHSVMLRVTTGAELDAALAGQDWIGGTILDRIVDPKR